MPWDGRAEVPPGWLVLSSQEPMMEPLMQALVKTGGES
jgi:hypothetical protein